MKKPDCYDLFHKHCGGVCLSNYREKSYSFDKAEKILLLAGFIQSRQRGSHWVYRHKYLHEHPQMTSGTITLVGHGPKKNRKIKKVYMQNVCKAIRYLTGQGHI